MTVIFRQAFCNIFSSARNFVGKSKPTVAGPFKVNLLQATLFRTNDRSAVGGDLPDYMLVVLVNMTANNEVHDGGEFWRSNFRTREAKIRLARSLGLGGIIDQLAAAEGRIVGQTSSPVSFDPSGLEAATVSVFAFYVNAWLRGLRIERQQLAAPLEAVSNLDLSSSIAIANQRLRILNQQRYFLTSDRTNNLVLRDFCRALVAKYKIEARHNRALDLHTAFEHHLDNSAKLHNSRQLGSVSNLILILTILSVPISFFGAVFAINLKSEALEHPLQLISDYRIYVAFLVGAAIVAIPFLLMKLFDQARRR